MLMSFMSCSIIVAWHENRDPSSIASGEHSPNFLGIDGLVGMMGSMAVVQN